MYVWPFGVVCGPLVYFFRFGMFGPRKIWQPWSKADMQSDTLKKFAKHKSKKMKKAHITQKALYGSLCGCIVCQFLVLAQKSRLIFM
jgi:hypothetical protein